MNVSTFALKKTARLAGLFYLLIGITAPFSLLYVPSKVIVSGDAAATAGNLLTHEFLFRSGIAVNLISQAFFILLVLMLYRLFRHVNEHQVKVMGALVLVSIPIAFMADVLKLVALMIVKGGILTSYEPQQAHEMAMLMLKFSSAAVQMLQLYWGLWLIPFGILVYKCGFIPRILGILLILNGIAYALICFTYVLFPVHLKLVGIITSPFLIAGEVPMFLWLLIIGVKNKEANRIVT